MKKLLAIAVILAVTVGMLFAGSTITMKGSDTLVRLGQRWAEVYMKQNSDMVIQVSGGGSGTGMARPTSARRHAI
jgi:phosphate transport system substrate-binding protein